MKIDEGSPRERLIVKTILEGFFDHRGNQSAF